MKKLIIFESLLIIFFVLAWNVSKAEKIDGNIWGLGTKDCGEVISDLNIGYEDIYTAYITGMLTGVFYESGNTSTASTEAVYLETINYCKANPLSSFTKAIYQTYIKLMLNK